MDWAEIEASLNRRIQRHASVRGGQIHAAFRLDLVPSGKAATACFLKYHPHAPSGIFTCEAAGLSALAKTGVVRVPAVLAVSENWLALEWIDSSSIPKDFPARLGSDFARLHQSQLAKRRYGWERDNFIGLLPQKNKWSADWAKFWSECRLLPQVKLAQKELDKETLATLTEIAARVPELLGKSAEEMPSPLHGDMWGENHLVGPDGSPVFIDPAFYFGHREADLAMATMFGAFPKEFFRAYEAAFPLIPGFWETRVHLYALYHELSHLNHFGASYLGRVKARLEQLK